MSPGPAMPGPRPDGKSTITFPVPARIVSWLTVDLAGQLVGSAGMSAWPDDPWGAGEILGIAMDGDRRALVVTVTQDGDLSPEG